MAGATAVFKNATIRISLSVLFGLPSVALIPNVLVQMGLASKVLPVVSVNTNVSLMLLIAERAPYSLEMKEVEIDISGMLMEHFNTELIFVVSKRAELGVFTLIDTFREGLAEFCLVLLRVIEIFNSVVCVRATIFEWAFLRFWAHL